MAKTANLDNTAKDLSINSTKEIYQEYKKLSANTKDKKMVYQLLRRITVLEERIEKLEERK